MELLEVMTSSPELTMIGSVVGTRLPASAMALAESLAAEEMHGRS